MEDFEKYSSLWDFLKKTPKNLWSVIMIWGMALAGIAVCVIDIHEFSKSGFIGATSFLILIMYLGWLRVYLLYERNK